MAQLLRRELMDDDGENLAVRWFLVLYGGMRAPSVGQMREHLEVCGFPDCWPQWVKEAQAVEHLTKSGAQLWLRHLFALENDLG